MAIPEGLRTALNAIRETSIQDNTLFARYVPEIQPDTDIGSYAAAITADQNVYNEFFQRLVKKIVYSQVETREFRNKLKGLEGDRLPLGAIGEEIYINPIKGRRFNVDDFAGLLAKYDADMKVQYPTINSDIQYPVTITRAKAKTAFTSWEALGNFITGITDALYNGAYIDEYNLTKSLVVDAYKTNSVQIETITAPTTAATADAFITKARELFLNMQEPTSDYNAWAKVGGYGNAVITWSRPEDIVFILRNDISSVVDVLSLAQAFNLEFKTLLGNIYTVKEFTDASGEANDKILGIMADRSWFRIKSQDFELDEFYNANNRTWQMYLNVTKMYQYSLFANAVVFATAAPTVKPTKITFNETAPTVEEDATVKLSVVTEPFQANDTITYTSSDSTKATVAADSNDNKKCVVTGVADGSVTITATCGNVTGTITVTVTDPE